MLLSADRSGHMITAVFLENFKSFGEQQHAPLQPITVLVGPNNSGKSNFLSVFEFIRAGLTESIEQRREVLREVSHRPPVSDRPLLVQWESGEARANFEIAVQGKPKVILERLFQPGSDWVREADHPSWKPQSKSGVPNIGVPDGLLLTSREAARQIREPSFERLFSPIEGCRMVKLSLDALRRPAPVVAEPALDLEGAGLAAVLGFWRGASDPKAQELDDFLARSMPEIRRAIVKPGPAPGTQQVWVRQQDGEEFPATEVADGVLFAIGLAAHAILAGSESLLLVEEPEQCIHPRRLGDVVDLFRRVVSERMCQIIIATHSPILLDEFRDEPECILLFRRGPGGTLVNPLTKFPTLVDSLRDVRPGELLAQGFFNEAA
jgi:predicted ATPase